MKRIVLLVVIMLALLAGAVQASGPVVWKSYCPAHHEVRLEPDKAGGVNVLCVMLAEEVQPGK